MVVQQLFGLFIGGIGGLMAFNAIRMFRASARRDTYEPVDARVIDSSLDTDSPRTGDASATYIPTITYEYTVEGETYSTDNLYPGPATSGSNAKDEQQALVDQYPEGATVEAYYDPTEPADAFLEKESRKQQAVGLGLVGGIVLLSGLVVFAGIVP